jgi:hypothetical protein
MLNYCPHNVLIHLVESVAAVDTGEFGNLDVELGITFHQEPDHHVH